MFSWIWEARSVNGKGLDIKCRLPQGLGELDTIVRKRVRCFLSRGSVSLHLSMTKNKSEPSYRINQELLHKLAKVTKSISAEFGSFGPPTLDGLLAINGVIEPEPEKLGEKQIMERNESILADLETVLKELVQVRREEGTRILEELNGLMIKISERRERLEYVEHLQPEILRKRLKQQVNEMLSLTSELSEDRVTQEVALLLIKGDIREELNRLKAHIEATSRFLSDGGVIGRNLEFLCQEFNREVNTLCSKASSLELTNLGLEIRALIEQFREQVQNIE